MDLIDSEVVNEEVPVIETYKAEECGFRFPNLERLREIFIGHMVVANMKGLKLERNSAYCLMP